jgi:hypothetical protein
VAVSSNLFLAASDEDNILRLYRVDGASNVVARFDLRRFLGKKETDLEAAARVGNRAYWIGSHAIGPAGKGQFARRVFFATDLIWSGDHLAVHPTGKVYRQLVENLLADSRFDRFELRRAATRMAKESHALDIEALAPGKYGSLLIGFRNPIPEGRALLIPLLNPERVIDGEPGKFGDPVEFDFGGLGLRDMVRAGNIYYLIAGSYNSTHAFRVYGWTGMEYRQAPTLLTIPPLGDLNPEALIFFPEQPAELLVVSDDGSRLIKGVPGKQIADESQQPFRWFRLKVDPALAE